MATLSMNSVTATGFVERDATRAIISSSSRSAIVENAKRNIIKPSWCAIPAKLSTGKASALAAVVPQFSGLRRLPAGKRSVTSGKGKKWQQYTKGPAREAHLRIVQMALSEIPIGPQGLYDPAMDRDACGVGFVAELSAQPTRQTVRTTTP